MAMSGATSEVGELRMVRLPEIQRRTGYSRSTIYNMIGRGDFPQPSKHGRATYWPSPVVDSWFRNLGAQ